MEATSRKSPRSIRRPLVAALVAALVSVGLFGVAAPANAATCPASAVLGTPRAGSATDYVRPYFTGIDAFMSRDFCEGSPWHTGTDWYSQSGPAIFPVRATQDGTVVKIGTDTVYGKYLVIEFSDGNFGEYAHLSSYNSSEDDTVTKGEVVAQSGNTGDVTGTHLHYSMSSNWSFAYPWDRGHVHFFNSHYFLSHHGVTFSGDE
jgi:hypothetical protein